MQSLTGAGGTTAGTGQPSASRARVLARRLLPRPIAVVRILLLVALIGLWEWGYREGHVNAFFFSAPSKIWSTLVTLFRSGKIWPHIEATARESLVGLVLGFVAGLVLG